ncbi:molybdenum cofactor biosysynthesis protein [Haloprofundus marisrubri]|uniref:Molybdenum cofactor biosysynthesis protein n=1 Tax=Haloprofundus marisrubri TaxID=1514971 RepID=A0A0W1R556_9EURY|nr:MOSC N-terminal beta barrel domain-containing protein [Haloprofundus marisrubri]KTG08379.1 molybdenum cofactor biosysynthesis protein [Haloprofundus marisrubri]
MATLRRIFVHPIKSLDPQRVDAATLVENGGLDGDREFALFDADGRYVNGKRNRDTHRLRSVVDFESETVRLDPPAENARTFELESEELTEWLSSYFGEPVTLERDRTGGFPDDTDASGPTVISTATIRELASWFPDIDAESMRRRLRPNLEIDGVPAFWEDRLFSSRNEVVEFTIGDADGDNERKITFEGINPCQRCVVPSRDPDTGAEYDGFRERFIEKREETMPEWSGGDWFDHQFRVMVNTRVDESDWGETLSVGDEVEIGETKTV